MIGRSGWLKTKTDGQSSDAVSLAVGRPALTETVAIAPQSKAGQDERSKAGDG